nr:heme oxygenase 2-like [Oncorhynchus nerka]
MGKDIQEEVMDAGMPVHGAHGTGGDINKCPYYAAQMAASGGSAYFGQLAMAVLRHPTGQVLFAAWVAALAGLAAWYFM